MGSFRRRAPPIAIAMGLAVVSAGNFLADERDAEPRHLVRVAPAAADRGRLAACGIFLEHKLSVDTWIARLPPAPCLTDDVAPIAEWIGERKLAPLLRAGRWPEWTLSADFPGWVMTFVFLHDDVALDQLPSIADDAGGVALGTLVGLRGATVWVPQTALALLAADPRVLAVEVGPPPLVPANDGVRAAMRIDKLTTPSGPEGTGVRIFVYDGGSVRATHQTFQPEARVTRLEPDDGASSFADHATHIAGIAAGDGDGGRARGVAPKALVLSAYFEQQGTGAGLWDDAGDIEADYSTARNFNAADLSTNSIAATVGGDTCEFLGGYSVTGALLDTIVRGEDPLVAGEYLVVWAAGNQRSSSDCGTGWATMASPSCAKNMLQIGGTHSDGMAMTNFSGWGPCADGRLQPLLVAPSCETGRVTGEPHVYSSRGTANDLYGPCYGLVGSCGTSMATPAAAGVVALLIEEWRNLGYGGATARPHPALVKALLMASAKDLGQLGPDYRFGYGHVDAVRAVDLLRRGTALDADGWTRFGTPSISTGQVIEYEVPVLTGSDALRVSLAWDDPPAAPLSAMALINDLDLEIVDPTGSMHRPFVLDPMAPAAPAVTGVDSLNNQEQVVIRRPDAGKWWVRIRGTSVPEGPQKFALVIEVAAATEIAASCTDVPAGDGFEFGADPWVLSGDAGLDASPAPAHGATSLRLGGTPSTTGTATLALNLPPAPSAIRLSLDSNRLTTELPNSQRADEFFVDITDASGIVQATPVVESDNWPGSTWLRTDEIDLSPWAGQSIRVVATATNNPAAPTTYWIDDVRIETCATCASAAAPTAVTVQDFDLCLPSGIAIDFVPATGADRHDILVNGVVTATDVASGAVVPLPDDERHFVSVRAMRGACPSDSAPVSIVDAFTTPENCVADVVALPGIALTPIAGDGDAMVEPGERWFATVTVENRGVAPAIGFAAALTAPGLVSCQSPAAFGNVLPGGTRSRGFEFVADPGVYFGSMPCGTVAPLSLVQKSSGPSGYAYPDDDDFAALTVGAPGPFTEISNLATPLAVSNGSAASDLLPAFTIAPGSASAASITWQVSGSASLTNCVEIRLRASDAVDLVLKTYGQTNPGSAGGATLTSFYNSHPISAPYRIVLAERTTPACAGGAASLSATSFSVTGGPVNGCDQVAGACSPRAPEVSASGSSPLLVDKGTGDTLDLSFADVGANAYNVYVSNRVGVPSFDSLSPNGAAACSVPTSALAAGRRLVDDFEPVLSAATIYLLVTADNGPGTEGSAGTDSAGAPRIVSLPCAP